MQEYLSPDILDENFIKNFSPLLYFQKIMGTCRVDLRHGFITPLSVWQKSIFALWFILLLGFHIDIENFAHKTMNHPSIYPLFIYAIIFHIVALLVSVIHGCFLNAQENVNFFIQLQKLDRLMKFDKIEIIYRSMDMTCIFLVTSCLLGAILGIGISIYYKYMWFVGTTLRQCCLSIELAVCCQIFIYFYVRLLVLNCVIENYVDGNPVRPNPGGGILLTKTRVLYLTSLSNNFVTDKTDFYLKELLGAFSRYQVLYQLQIAICFIKFIPYSMWGFHILSMSGLPVYIPYDDVIFLKISAYGMILLDFIAIVLLSLLSDLLIKEVLRTKCLCINVMALNPEGPLRDKAKNMLIRIKQNMPALSVYDMWSLKGYTIVNVIQIITTLVITMLQFMYL